MYRVSVTDGDEVIAHVGSYANNGEMRTEHYLFITTLPPSSQYIPRSLARNKPIRTPDFSLKRPASPRGRPGAAMRNNRVGGRAFVLCHEGNGAMMSAIFLARRNCHALGLGFGCAVIPAKRRTARRWRRIGLHRQGDPSAITSQCLSQEVTMRMNAASGFALLECFVLSHLRRGFAPLKSPGQVSVRSTSDR